MPTQPRLFTIPPGAPFLVTLVDALLDGTLIPDFHPRGDPLALAGATIFLPTRRSIRALRTLFLDRLGGEAAILPRLLALGEVDEDEAAFDATAEPLALPDSLGGLDRQLALTRLVLGWSRRVKTAILPLRGESEPLLIPSSPGDAAQLALTLGRFMDGLETERVPFERLKDLKGVHDGRYDRYFDLTLDFLTIVTEAWPAFLAEQGRMDAVARRNRLIEAETRRFGGDARTGPVIVAGSTGSIPATRDLIGAVAHHPLGAVVLPGLDLTLDEAAWRSLGGETGEATSGHPQAGLFALLAAIGGDRASVRTLGAGKPARERLVAQALRPASGTDRWVLDRADGLTEAPDAFAEVMLVEAATDSEEALAIAVLLRETLEHPDQRAALVTPDRGLAARVVAELARWGITADDSAGRALMATPPGILARLVLDAALTRFEPVAVLALLKHPLCGLAIGRKAVEAGLSALEIGALRGPAPPPGLEGLRVALENGRASLAGPHAQPARLRLTDADWAAAEVLMSGLEKTVGPLAAMLGQSGDHPAASLFAAHSAAFVAAADGAALAVDGAGADLLAFLAELGAVPAEALALPAAAYPGLFAAVATGRSVRGGDPAHPRLAIYGLLEARLLPVDRLVLGGLDEGVWPPAVQTDPWLNRPMRTVIGLGAPERRIGLSAHDFTQGLGADQVIITRALKRGGTPTVPARWLQRLKAYLGRSAAETRDSPSDSDAHAAMVARGQRALDLARLIDAPTGPPVPARAPAPCPPLSLRPVRLSVTEIEHLLRDPYTIYARHVLRLDPIDALALPPDAADRGTLVHEVVRRFAEICHEGVPADAEAVLARLAAQVFGPVSAYPDVAAFWLPRLDRIAAFLATWERARRPALAAVAVEVSGRLAWPTSAGRVFTLRGKADRIETGLDGAMRLVDFKTGRVPSEKQVRTGLSPQLPLEAAMLLEGGFKDLAVPAALSDNLYVALTGDRQGGMNKPIIHKDMSTEDMAREALLRLKALIDRFEDEAMPYRSMLHPMFKTRRYGDYDHLARVREWSLAGGEGDAE